MNKFSIKIDLSTFFEDERKMVLIMVDNKWENVARLSRRVEELFGVDGVRFINNDGCFLPPQEPIEIVRFCKDLKAFIPKVSLDKRKKKKSKKGKTDTSTVVHNDDEEEEEEKEPIETADSGDADVNDRSKKKRKYCSLGLVASSTPNNSKRIKNYIGINATLTNHQKQINKSSEISSTSEQQMPPPGYPSSLEATAEKSNNENTVVAGRQADEEELSLKSKHKKKSSKLAKGSTIETNTVPPTARISTLPSSTFINDSKKSKSNPFKNHSSTVMHHIHFDESGEISTTTNKTKQDKENDEPAAEPIKVVFQSALQDTDAKRPRVFHIRQSNTIDKQKIEIQENIILKPILPQNGLNTSQVFEETQTVGNNESISDIDKSLIIDNNCKEKEMESSVDEGNSSLNDTNISSASTAIDTCARKSKNLEKLKEINQSKNNAAEIEVANADENQSQMGISTNQNTNSILDNDQSVKDEADESSIVSIDCVDLSVDDEVEQRKQSKKQMKSSSNIEDISISDNSDVEEVSEVIDLNETEDHGNSYSSSKNVSPKGTLKVIQIIGLCMDTKEIPSVGDIMMFKVPFTNRQGNPDCTKFLAGKVERIQQRTKTIKFLVLDGHSEMCYVPSKYLDNFLDNSTCEQNYIQIKFSEMIQPRILPKNKRSMFSFI